MTPFFTFIFDRKLNESVHYWYFMEILMTKGVDDEIKDLILLTRGLNKSVKLIKYIH